MTETAGAVRALVDYGRVVISESRKAFSKWVLFKELGLKPLVWAD